MIANLQKYEEIESCVVVSSEGSEDLGALLQENLLVRTSIKGGFSLSFDLGAFLHLLTC